MLMGHSSFMPAQPIAGTIHQATAEEAIVTCQRGQTSQSAHGLTTIGMTIDTIRDTQQSGRSRCIGASQLDNGFRGEACNLCRTFGRELQDALKEMLPTQRVLCYPLWIMKFFRDHDIHHGKRKGSICSWIRLHMLVG